MNEDYEKDKIELTNIITKSIGTQSNNGIEQLAEHILSYKYHTNRPATYPTINFNGISQNALIKVLKNIRTTLNLDKGSREYFAELFSMIPYPVNDGFQHFNKQTLYKNMG